MPTLHAAAAMRAVIDGSALTAVVLPAGGWGWRHRRRGDGRRARYHAGCRSGIRGEGACRNRGSRRKLVGGRCRGASGTVEGRGRRGGSGGRRSAARTNLLRRGRRSSSRGGCCGSNRGRGHAIRNDVRCGSGSGAVSNRNAPGQVWQQDVVTFLHRVRRGARIILGVCVEAAFVIEYPTVFDDAR